MFFYLSQFFLDIKINPEIAIKSAEKIVIRDIGVAVGFAAGVSDA